MLVVVLIAILYLGFNENFSSINNRSNSLVQTNDFNYFSNYQSGFQYSSK